MYFRNPLSQEKQSCKMNTRRAFGVMTKLTKLKGTLTQFRQALRCSSYETSRGGWALKRYLVLQRLQKLPRLSLSGGRDMHYETIRIANNNNDSSNNSSSNDSNSSNYNSNNNNNSTHTRNNNMTL